MYTQCSFSVYKNIATLISLFEYLGKVVGCSLSSGKHGGCYGEVHGLVDCVDEVRVKGSFPDDGCQPQGDCHHISTTKETKQDQPGLCCTDYELNVYRYTDQARLCSTDYELNVYRYTDQAGLCFTHYDINVYRYTDKNRLCSTENYINVYR